MRNQRRGKIQPPPGIPERGVRFRSVSDSPFLIFNLTRMLTVRRSTWGVCSYRDCWEYQQRLFDVLTARRGDASDDAGWLLTVEHPPVYTLGKSGKAQNLLVGEEFLRAKGAEYYHIDRGGDITSTAPTGGSATDSRPRQTGNRPEGVHLPTGKSVIEVVGRYNRRPHRRRFGRLDRRRGAARRARSAQ